MSCFTELQHIRLQLNIVGHIVDGCEGVFDALNNFFGIIRRHIDQQDDKAALVPAADDIAVAQLVGEQAEKIIGQLFTAAFAAGCFQIDLHQLAGWKIPAGAPYLQLIKAGEYVGITYILTLTPPVPKVPDLKAKRAYSS